MCAPQRQWSSDEPAAFRSHPLGSPDSVSGDQRLSGPLAAHPLCKEVLVLMESEDVDHRLILEETGSQACQRSTVWG